jgi:dTDP-glucose 4,6-dehydratase
MLRALVTGADGFIGSHLTEKLVIKGYHVRALVYYNSFNSWGWIDQLASEIKESLEIFPGDIRDPYQIRKAMQDCDLVFHLAAIISIPHSYQAPDSYIDTNIKGTLNILQAARDLDVEKVIHTSTSEVYGTACFVPITENHPLQAQSPYAASKIGADQLVLSFYNSYGTPVAIVRPFNTYGPRQSARAVIPTIITQIANRQRRLKLGSLHPTRDFSYVKDTASGFVAAAESDKSVGEIINIGSGFEISIGDTAKIIAEIMESEIETECYQERVRPATSEVERLWADNSKAKRLLNWQPKFRGLDGFRKGIKKTIAWFSRANNLKYYKWELFNV